MTINVEDINPESLLKTTAKCPVCRGFGSFRGGSVECNGCHGKGWVVVNLNPGEKFIEPVERWEVKRGER